MFASFVFNIYSLNYDFTGNLKQNKTCLHPVIIYVKILFRHKIILFCYTDVLFREK